jgi:hypothetical protein
MTAHFPGLVTIPSSHVDVLGVSLPSHESEQSCIYVLVVSLPSQESEQSCVCVRGIVTKPGE